MAILRNQRKLAAVSRSAPEKTRNNPSQNTLHPGMAEEYINQDSKKIKGRVTEELSQESSRTESSNLGALYKLDEFLLNPHVRTCSLSFPGTCRNSNSENREPTGDRSPDDPCPKARFFSHHPGNLNSSELEDYPHMVKGFPEEFRNRSHMVTEFQEEIPYCYPGTSSGKQKKAHSTSQPQFRSEKTPATNEADQILSALQQLATNSNSANFNNNIKRFSKLPKSLTTTTFYSTVSSCEWEP